MSDPRLTLMREGLADVRLEGVVEADRFVEPRAMRCGVYAAAILKAADAASEQQDQIVFGEAFDVLSEEAGFSFGQARRDGYVGWVETAALADGVMIPTHWVRAPRTLAFSRPDIKSAVVMPLTMNSLVREDGREGRFVKIAGAGWVIATHLSPIGVYETDPAAIAAEFIGQPYLWGGREAGGLDCSGLVQQAAYACAEPSARDADMQAGLGEAIEAAALARGDLVFWKGHVGMMTDGKTVLHANAHHMAVREEPLAEADERIKAAGAGEPTGFRRV